MSEFNIGFVVFPNLTQLDFTGPYEVLSRLSTPPSIAVQSKIPESKVHVIAKRADPIPSDRGLQILPTCTFSQSPPLDLICVPGGGGVVDALSDDETVDFVRSEGSRARYVTSVCMGAFLLGAAELLQGRRATTHWAYVDLLTLVGAKYKKSRVVRDGNVTTAAGVSAGIDFGFVVVAELAGAEVARAIQLGIEYDPAPPFEGGHPDKASAEALELMVARNRTTHDAMRDSLEALRR